MSAKKSIYVETTIPSFATAKTSRDAIIALMEIEGSL
jgi:hypothetical protein